MAKAGAGTNALVLNHRSTDRLPAGSVGSPITFGRCVPKPANALLLVVWVTASGMPDCSVSTPVSVQSLTRAPATPLAHLLRPVPHGMSHTADATRMCGMSPVE